MLVTQDFDFADGMSLLTGCVRVQVSEDGTKEEYLHSHRQHLAVVNMTAGLLLTPLETLEDCRNDITAFSQLQQTSKDKANATFPTFHSVIEPIVPTHALRASSGARH